MTNIIADIAGNYKTLLALLEKMPEGEIISLGDLVDRGPRSKEVLDFFMDPDKDTRAILGNHEHMMLSTCRDTKLYSSIDWIWNGGDATLRSFGEEETPLGGMYNSGWGGIACDYYEAIPNKYLEWLESLPLYIEIGDVLLSHSFMYYVDDLEKCCDLNVRGFAADCTIIWNREDPQRSAKYRLQVAGHNSQMGLKRFEDKLGMFALCIDDCRIGQKLTGYHLESDTIYQQEYID